MPAGEIYLPLAADFADNRKVRALMRYGREARQARDLFVQMLCHCKGTRSDGFVADEQVGLLVYPDSEKIGKRDAERLAAVGLITRDEGGWLIPGWLDRNPSRAEIEEKSAAKARGARLANHRRWHEDSTDPDCEWCVKEGQTTDLSTDQITDPPTDTVPITGRIGAAKRSDSKEEEEESEEESVKTGRRAARKPEPGSDDDPDFCAFWDSYPKRVAKGQARKTWKTLVTKGHVEPKVMILGAERYRDDRRRPYDMKFVPNPSTWLNAESWLDQDETAAPPPAPRPPAAFWEN